MGVMIHRRLTALFLALLFFVAPTQAANEITISQTLQYLNAALGITPAIELSEVPTQFTITGKNYAFITTSVPTTAGGTAIPLGNLGSLGFAIFKNLDATNYVTILTAVSGTGFIRIPPLGSVAIYFDPGITAPAMLSHTAACLVQYLILEV